MKLHLTISVLSVGDVEPEDALFQLLAAANKQSGITITVPGRAVPNDGTPQGTHIDVDLVDVERLG